MHMLTLQPPISPVAQHGLAVHLWHAIRWAIAVTEETNNEQTNEVR